jgi:hypothetical protein
MDQRPELFPIDIADMTGFYIVQEFLQLFQLALCLGSGSGFSRILTKYVTTGRMQNLPVFAGPSFDAIYHHSLSHLLELLHQTAFIGKILQGSQHLIGYPLHRIEHPQ